MPKYINLESVAPRDKTRVTTPIPEKINKNNSPSIMSQIKHLVKMPYYYAGFGDNNYDSYFEELNNPIRVTQNTKNVDKILTNEFIENNTNSIRKAKDFKQTNDTIVGDIMQIPLSKIKTYYGIENGKLKAGDINSFNDTTTIVPNRTKYYGKIKEVIGPTQKDIDNYYETSKKASSIAEENKEKEAEQIVKQKKLKFDATKDLNSILTYINKFGKPNNYDILVNQLGYNDDWRKISDNYNRTLRDISPYPTPKIITESNDTISNANLNGPKIIFADDKGHAAFVRNVTDKQKELNEFLKKYPSYPIMVDNGRYNHYTKNSGNESYDKYVGADFYRSPNKMYVIGTKK